jgi:hypothetical protein
MMITLEKVQCWEPGTGFNVFLDKSAEIDLAEIAKKRTAQYVQVGPYRVKIDIDSGSGGPSIKGLRVGTSNFAPLASSDVVSGSVFVYLPTEVERVSMNGNPTTLGSASGCFEVHW